MSNYGKPPGPPGYGPPPQQQQQPSAQQQPQQQQPYAPANPYAPQPQYGYPPPPQYGAMQPQQQYPQQGYPQQQQYPGQPVQVIVQNQIQPYAQPYAPYGPYGVPMHPDARKKDTAVLLAILGVFFGLSGLQRFYLREPGMGVLYLLTGGLCLVGQIIDVVTLMSMTEFDFNVKYNGMMLPR